MPKPKAKPAASDLILWAVSEIRGLDELCRGQVPGYEPLESADIEKLNALKALAADLGYVRAQRPAAEPQADGTP